MPRGSITVASNDRQENGSIPISVLQSASTLWGLPVLFSRTQHTSAVKHTVAEWSKLGVRRLDHGKLPPSTIAGSIVAPDGAGGRAFLVYDNFRVIMKWNHSTYFAVAINMLADEIGN